MHPIVSAYLTYCQWQHEADRASFFNIIDPYCTLMEDVLGAMMWLNELLGLPPAIK